MWFYLYDLETLMLSLKEYVGDAPLVIKSIVPAVDGIVFKLPNKDIKITYELEVIEYHEGDWRNK